MNQNTILLFTQLNVLKETIYAGKGTSSFHLFSEKAAQEMEKAFLGF